MDVLSVSEAFMYALEVVGQEYQYIVSGNAVLRTVPEIMEANGWFAMKNTAGEILYYTRPAQAVLETGVKTYTEVAEVTAVTTESGAVTGATVTTSGVGVSVGVSALACAATASYGYNIGNQIYDVSPNFWDGMLEEVNKWTVENVPEGGVNAIVTVLDGVDSVLTFPSTLLDRLYNYILDSGVEDSSFIADVPTESGTYSFPNMGWSYDLADNTIRRLIAETSDTNVKTKLNLILSNLQGFYTNCYNKYHVSYPCMTLEIDVRTGAGSISIGGVKPNDSYTISANDINTDAFGNKYINLSYGGNRYYDTMYYDGTYKTDQATGSRAFTLGFDYTVVSGFGSICNTSSLAMSFIQGVDGVSKQDGATYPIDGSNVEETYPNWWNKGLIVNNGSGGSTNWLPLSITDKNAEYFGDPQTQADAQSGTKTKTENSNIQVVDTVGVLDIPNNPPTDDKGSTPVLFPPTSIFGIAGIYNPTLTELRNFSNWLWSADPITQLAQMFNDPMNGIIGLHAIYVTPHTEGSKTIGVGYLSSGVQSKVVDNQYVTIDCGSVEIPSYFNNVNDWSPYTKISCYLPFIGIVDLNTDDVMSSADKQCSINITYKVDVLTGACLCMIGVKRGSVDAVLYQYNGSCSVQLPLTSGNYGTMIASLITTAVGVGTGVGAIAVGGALSALHSKANVQRSGQLGANVGAMGIKKPYLIIERPYSKYAGSYAKHIGYPSNNTVTLSSCKGFTRVKASDVTNINTTEEERNMIYELLKNGVYV